MARGKYCSFCGRSAEEAGQLITSGGVAICRDCVETCHDMFKNSVPAVSDGEILSGPVPTPREIKEYLDEYVIGQDEAKRVLSVAVYNHYKRVINKDKILSEGVELDKSNILMIGPTGTGKTLLARTLAKKLQVPFAIADATTLTEAGYVGEDVENILLKLIDAADYDIAKAQKGIIFIDEIDKIAKKSENVSITRDVSGEGVQQALLKIIEGTVASVPPQGGRKHPNQEMLKIDTKDILFICGGAFVGLEKVIERRTRESNYGFGSSVAKKSNKEIREIYKSLHPDDLVKFGLIPEFIGRLPIHVTLDDLRLEDLKRIITEPKNSIIKQYQASMKLDGISLIFTDDAVSAIAEKAYTQKTGARGLRSIVENLMLGISYDLPSIKEAREVIIDRENVESDKEPKVLLADGNEYVPQTR
ncbi:MAG TPA: ATP-dependent protease ATP-binding subunit ClpX [Candidatus Ornithospirochaeta avicola]|uniref:ATP-dependent Clp protease ATP-binding subunit ClpX n=1 Tax=Candidatus Ornithospirochaeta avicola TaxID=2840896 RepID=A0A9D1PUL2_9SPIO|nr:ATP-dependent protease ATP-binding subunit ClpX [Candidatus Ornithospirochaeta avicola]